MGSHVKKERGSKSKNQFNNTLNLTDKQEYHTSNPIYNHYSNVEFWNKGKVFKTYYIL